MIGSCAFHVLPVLSVGPFYVDAPGRFPDGTAGCFIYNGKRSEMCDDLHYTVPQNVSRSINMLVRREHLSRTNLLGLRMMFAFIVHPKFFRFEDSDLAAASQLVAAPEVEPGTDSR